MKPVYFKSLITGAALFLTPMLHAVQHTYWLGDFAVAEANDEDLAGVRILSGNAHAGHSFTLNDGQSTDWFNVLDIWTDEKHVSADDLWTNAFALSTTIKSGSDWLSYEATGETVGIRKDDWSGTGYLNFYDPLEFTLGGRVVRLEFADTFFGAGPKKYYGLAPGQENSGTVMARLHQVSSAPVNVPDAASTAAIFGIGLAALALAARRGRRAV